MAKLTRLGELERAVMDHLWSSGEPQTVRQVHEALSAHRDLANAQHRAEVAALWGVPQVPDKPGRTAVEMFQAAADGEIRALWIACTNPAQSMPDQRTVRRALERCELVVVQEAFATTATCAYADLLLDSTGKSCVLLIDFRRYSRHFRILAEECAARGIPLAIITDSQCYWARQLTEHVLMLPAEMERPWHNFTAATSLLSLLIGAVTREQGDMFDRIGDITQLRQKLVGYVEAPAVEKREPAASAKGRRAAAAKTGGTPHRRRGKPGA